MDIKNIKGLNITVTFSVNLKDGHGALYLSENDYSKYLKDLKPKICNSEGCNKVIYHCGVCISHYGELLENED